MSRAMMGPMGSESGAHYSGGGSARKAAERRRCAALVREDAHPPLYEPLLHPDVRNAVLHVLADGLKTLAAIEGDALGIVGLHFQPDQLRARMAGDCRFEQRAADAAPLEGGQARRDARG